MSHEPDPAADDPEIAALLNFPPVIRRNKRHDGWGPAEQKGFIAWLAATGNVDKAAQAVGRTQSGAWGVRNAMGGEGFSEAWEAALDLFHARRRAGKLEELAAPPPGPRHTHRRVRELREAKAFRKGAPDRGAANLRRRVREARANGEQVLVASELEAERKELLDEILKRYLVKLQAERTARLDGRIVEADYYVRQLTFIELVLDIGGHAQEGLAALGNYDFEILQLTATPGSVLLEKARRAIWQEKGEADRPPPAPLGRHDDRRATGEPTDYNAARDGDFATWERRTAEKRKLAADAQVEWERRAKGEGPGDPSSPSLGPANDSPEELPGPSAAEGGDPPKP